jgi:uncharacterized protein (TIGR02001 family)
MKKILVVVLASFAVFALPVTASMAAESSANAALTSNYVYRGLSDSNDGIAVQGGYDIQQSKQDLGWYAGTFASTVGDIGSDGFEVDVYGGWKGAFNNNRALGYEVGGIFYKYTDSARKDITEIFAGINYETAYLKVFFGNTSGSGSHNYIDLGASFVVMKDIDLNVHYGRYSSSASDYNDLSASMTTAIKGFDIGLGLTYQDLTTNKNIKFIVTASKKFDL